MSIMAQHRDFRPGTKVKLSGRFLASTGQRVGGEGAKRWVVVACDCGLCRSGRFVATDERHERDVALMMWTEAELATNPRLWVRHIAKYNLVVCGQIDIRNCV